MSSKSRKKTPPLTSSSPVTGQRTTPAQAPAGAEHDDEHGLLGEDVIHVPKGKNRVRYAIMIALLVFLTIIFLVPGAILATFLGPAQGDPVYLAFLGPDGKAVELRESEFQDQNRAFDNVFDLGERAIQELAYLRLFLGLPMRGTLKHEQVARLIVLDRLAADAGIVITDEEVAAFLGTVEGLSSDRWRAVTQAYGGASKVEASLKRLLGIRRYLDLVGKISSVPDVERIEALWAEEHVEVAYDYVALPTEGFVEQAKAEAPDDETLQAWLDERTDFEKSQFFTPARFRAVVAKLPDPAAAGALVERYPDTSGETPETRAELYYNEVFFTRFPRTDAGEDESAYLPLDEVRDVAMAEAPGYFAAKAWVADMRSRVDAGGELDFTAEAADLGLQLVSIDEPSTLDEIREREGLGPFVVGPVSQTPAGQVAPKPVIEPSGVYVVHVTEKLAPSLPELAEIRDDVLAKWAEARARDLALERLSELREGFEAFEPEDAGDDADETAAAGEEADEPVHRRADEDAFRAAAEAAGFEVGRRDWRDKSAPAADDPDAQKPAHLFFTRNRQYAELAEGQVPEPALDGAQSTAYLVRKVGERRMDVSRMTPAVYNNYKMRSAGEASNAVREFLTGEGLDRQYGIELVRRAAEDEGADEASDDASDDGADETTEG